MALVYWFGNEGRENVMVMEVLGPSLENIFSYAKQQVNLKTVLMRAEQTVS